MNLRTDILQELIDSSGEYLIVNRYLEGAGASRGKDEWQALFVAPNIPHELLGQKIVDMPYKIVEKFANTDSRSCIHFGKTYSPFQYGIYYKDFISTKKVTCKSMDLIVQCYNEDITDYYKVVELMEKLTEKEA